MSEVTVAAAVSAGSSEILQRLIDTTRECVLIVDSDLRIASCNASAAMVFGRPGIELEQRRLSEVIRDLDVHEAYRRAIGERFSSDVRLELIGAERRTFDVHIAPLEIDGRPLTGDGGGATAPTVHRATAAVILSTPRVSPRA